jgi:3-keto-disaccharide hydrolase
MKSQSRLLVLIGLPALLFVGLTSFAGQQKANNDDLGFTDTPMLPGLPFHVHDPDRPHPRVVTPAAQIGEPPSDAIILFNGKDLSSWEAKAWKVQDGYFEVAPGAGDLATKERFGDIQLHVEWASPAVVRGTSQNRGNSGIYLQGLYEVQVLDSYANPTYADGQAGALYGQWPPLANATRKPGEWQTYDIVFEAPHIDNGRVAKPAYMTVFLNGVLLHNRKELMGPTVYRQLAKYGPQPAEGPIMLQDHGAAVRYRNIWVRRLGAYDQPEK